MEMQTLRKVQVSNGVPMVYYNHKRRRTSDVFQLIDRELNDGSILLAEDQFSEKTMQWVSDDTPLTLSIGSTARTGKKIIDQEDVVEANTREPSAISEVKRGPVTRPGRKEEVGRPKKTNGNDAKKLTAKSKELSGNKKEKKDLNPNKLKVKKNAKKSV